MLQFKLTLMVSKGALTLGNNNTNLEKASKRTSILNTAITEFCKGYEEGSTYAIIKAAGVSKGLLFHHFGTKKDLFLQTYDYAIEIVMTEFYGLINLEQRDILERWKQVALLKMDLMQKHPRIFDFINHAAFTESEEVKTEIAERRGSFTEETYPKLFYDINRSLFREDIDADIAIKVILYTIEGYAQGEADAGKSSEDYYSEYKRYLDDLERYIQFFKQCFYKGGNEDVCY